MWLKKYDEGWRFGKPFDFRFRDLMIATARVLLTDFNSRYAYTESDEIPPLFSPSWDLFGRSVEKILSVSDGIVASAFTRACGESTHFDSRIWIGTCEDDVIDCPPGNAAGLESTGKKKRKKATILFAE